MAHPYVNQSDLNQKWIPLSDVTFPSDADPVNHPSHYQSPSGLEVVDVIEAFAATNAHRSAAIKYLLRAGHKGALVEDLRKCIWWIEREIAWANKERM